jgi:hypothetical protein
MSFKRFILCLPVVTGLVLTASAVARMAPAENEGAAPSCAGKGVRQNPQGHPSCGLHAGWTARQATESVPAPADDHLDEPVDDPVDEPVDDPADEDATDADDGTADELAAEKVCKRNGVHPNKNGHPTCGLHKGWTKHQSERAPEGATQQSGKGDRPKKDHVAAHGAGNGHKQGKHSH